MVKVLRFFLLFFFWLHLTVILGDAQQLVCQALLYSRQNLAVVGTSCSFEVRSGTQVTIEAAFINSIPVKNPSQIRVYSSSGPSVLLHRQEGDLERWRYTVRESRQESVWYKVEPQIRGTEHLSIRVWIQEPTVQQKTNLIPLIPRIDRDTGDLYFGYEVASDVPLNSNGKESGARVYYGREGRAETFVKGISLALCEGRARCKREMIISRAERKALELGQNQLIAVVDPQENIGETSGKDNKVVVTIDDFLVEDIRHIMRNTGWPIAASVQDRWFAGEERVANISASTDGFDFSGGGRFLETRSVEMDWVIENAPLASGTQGAINKLIDPSRYGGEEIYKQIRRNILFLRTNQREREVPLSDSTQKGALLFRQTLLQDATKLGNPVNEVYATVGRIGIYSLPLGVARRVARGTYEVTFQGVGVVLFDSFDFESEQPLGCWARWSYGPVPIPGVTTCIWNSDFQVYRKVKKRGGDYMIQSDVKPYYFEKPKTFVLEMR